jgi:hypothetical protein
VRLIDDEESFRQPPAFTNAVCQRTVYDQRDAGCLTRHRLLARKTPTNNTTRLAPHLLGNPLAVPAHGIAPCLGHGDPLVEVHQGVCLANTGRLARTRLGLRDDHLMAVKETDDLTEPVVNRQRIATALVSPTQIVLITHIIS